MPADGCKAHPVWKELLRQHYCLFRVNLCDHLPLTTREFLYREPALERCVDALQHVEGRSGAPHAVGGVVGQPVAASINALALRRIGMIRAGYSWVLPSLDSTASR